MTLSQTNEYEIIRNRQKSPPVDVIAIAEALGLAVWESDLPSGISGKIMRDTENGGSSGFSVILNRGESFVRKHFTLAHEIAHFVLHRDRIGSELSDDSVYRSGLSTREEAQANRLAADILMPRHLIEQERRFDSDPEVLADRFQVSVQAMRIRLGLPSLALAG